MRIEHFEVNERSSRVITAGELIFIGGTTAPADVEGIGPQTRAVLERLEALLKEHGSNKSCLLSATIYLRSMEDYAGMNAVWNDWLKDVVPPTRACICAVLAGNHALVEISLIGALL